VEILGEAMRKPACEKGFILDGFPRSTAQAEKVSAATGRYTHTVQ